MIVSIIIPHLNQHEWIETCLNSIQNQSFPIENIEVLLVDNGSDRLPEKELSAFSFAKLLVETTPGPGPARNLGVREAKGDYLFFIDADCRAHKDWIKNGLNALEADGAPAAIGGDVLIDYVDPIKLTSLEAYESVFAYRQEEYIKKMGFSGAGNLATRPKTFRKVGDFPGLNVAEDRSWGKMALANGVNFAFIKDMVIYHPARKNADDIYAKWDRHTRHDFAETEDSGLRTLKWLIRTCLVLVSIIVHIPKILVSKKLHKTRDRFGAFAYLARIRFFRVKAMLRLLFDKEYREKGVTWNR